MDLPAAWATQDLGHLLDSLGQNVRRGHINLGYTHDDGHAQSKRYCQMFLGHADEPGISSDDEYDAGWGP